MRKIYLLLFILALGTGWMNAASIDLTTAQRAAGNFIRTTHASELRSGDLTLASTALGYYVFNVGSEGFVVVSSDDRFRPIIGYSNEGAFGINDSPELLYYLDNLAQGRQAALRANLVQDRSVREEWALLLAGKPLPSRHGGQSFYLVQTKWDQGDPYNKFCPSNSYAGCVATAMSQVMNYWKYPTHGMGQHKYVHYQYGEISADFSVAEYDFDKMPLILNNMSPDEQVDPVALFMYHCGIAVDMDYSPSGSGAYSQDVPEAVISYFGYTNRCRYRPRDSYSLREFQAILRDQFDMGWPCYYSGSDTNGQGGHAFVCDGYDDNDMFHFNWGWSGSGNGYYVIDGLDVSGYAFNSGQAVIINFVPSEVFENTLKAPEYFTAVPNGDADFSVTLSWKNPAATLDGHPVDAIDQVVVMRDGVVVKTFDNPTPGESVTFVDAAGLPVLVRYSIYAVLAGQGGRRAYSEEINLGPTCTWTIKTRSTSEEGWGSGAITFMNASGKELGSFMAENAETIQSVEVPQGWVTFLWDAPVDSVSVGIEILDADDNPVFTYEGPSTLMPNGIFYEIVNRCGGRGYEDHPSALKASVEGDDVLLNWTGVGDPGYGYNIYRDGLLYTMVADTTSFKDLGAAQVLHSYYVTAFCTEGETDPSNTCCAMQEMEGMCPRNLDLVQNDAGQMLLTWEAPENTEGLSGYRIYRKDQREDYKLLKSVTASHTSFVLGGLEEGTRYYYKVIGMYDHGHLESSPAHALLNPDLLYVEVNLTHLPSGLCLQKQENGVELTWESALRAETYNVYRNGELLAEGLTEVYYTDGDVSSDGRQSYWVTGVVNGVESSPSNKVYYGSYALGEIAGVGIRLYPNPSTGMVTIEAESLLEVLVYNLSGQLILRVPATGSVMGVDFSSLRDGVYSLKLVTGQGDQVKKLVLMK